MATVRETSEEAGAEELVMEKQISEIRSATKLLFEITRPVDELLERLGQCERKWNDELHRRKAERHDREKQQELIQRLVELESGLKHVEHEKHSLVCKVETLECQNAKLKDSLQQATKESKQQLQKIQSLECNITAIQTELRLATASAPKTPKTVSNRHVGEPQKQLSETNEILNATKQELSTTRQTLSEVRDRLIVLEQVTAATQQRELQESNVIDDELQLLQPSQEHHVSATHQGTAGSDVLRALYSELPTTLDARIVAVNMYQRNALTLRELQLIQSLRDRPVEAAETLLNIILEQPDAVYLCFLDVLKHTDQQHIYQKLVTDAFRNDDDQSSHTTIIRAHYVFLLENLDVKFSRLIDHLYSDQVVSAVEMEDIRAQKTSFRANEKLLSVLSRKSPQQFQLFLDALDKCGQHHVRNVVTDRPDDGDTGVAINEPLQVAATAGLTDKSDKPRESLLLISLGEMIYEFLSHTVDIKRSHLTDKLVARNVLSFREQDQIKKEKKADERMNILMRAMRQKSSAQFENFLATLSETGQQSLVDVVRQALQTVGQTDRNPLQYVDVAQVVHTLPEGEPVAGVTSMRDYVYLLRLKDKDQVEVYDAAMFSLQHRLTLPNAFGFVDMTSCGHFLCLYIASVEAECIHKLDVQCNADSVTQWPVGDEPCGLSVTTAHNLLVTCRRVNKIKEFSSRGELVRETTLSEDVFNPQHTIQTLSGQYVVCHGDSSGVHRVVWTSGDVQHIVHSHGGHRGPDADQCSVPRHLAVDNNEYVFVIDLYNRRVKMLSPTLKYIRQVASRDQFKWKPRRLCLDAVRRRLYVVDDDGEAGEWTAGRVVVFCV